MWNGDGYDPLSIGWRLRVLRLRRDLTLLELAQGAGLDISYLSRLERDALQNAKAKPDTINRVLEALHASPQEHDAVYHNERPPLSDEEIAWHVEEVASREEDSPEPVVLGDEHWYVWYYNRAARAAMGLSQEDYRGTVGGHLLLFPIDRDRPIYSRVPETDRVDLFALRARIFKLQFAGEEFDQWYQHIVSRIYDVPWAVSIWENPEVDANPFVLERHEIAVDNPLAGRLRFTFQLNHLTANPRFIVVNWTPIDAETAAVVDELRALPEFSYGHSMITAYGALSQPSLGTVE